MKNDELEIVYRQYYRQLFIYAFSLTQNKEDAEDLVANTFVKALLSFEEGNIKSWLYIVLRNEFMSMYKKRKRLVSYDFENTEGTLAVIQDFIKSEEKIWLYQKINELPQREKEIMLLSLQSDFDDQTISHIMKMSIENVRVIRHRVKRKLIELCQKEGYL